MLVRNGLTVGMMVVGLSLACSTSRQFSDSPVGEEAAGGGDGAGGEMTAAGGTQESNLCDEDEFADGTSCQPLTTCAEDEFEQSPPGPARDRVCAKATQCGPGFWATTGTGSKDTRCTPCDSGTFSTTENAASCEPWSTCAADQLKTRAGTATSDVVCSNKGCSTAEDRECTAECPCASGEGRCTESDQCVRGATCVSGSGKKVGRSENTCLATHCNNDKLDADETSIDCGGECRCGATLEIVTLQNIPDGFSSMRIAAMSRDGQRLGGNLGRGKTSYPVAIARDGTVTELPYEGTAGGTVVAASADGNVLIGRVYCTDPPSCSDASAAVAQWSGTAPPKVLGPGNALATSSSGTIVAGDYYDELSTELRGFIINGNSWVGIPELTAASGVTPDGKYVAGPLQTGVQAGLWFAQTKNIVKIGSEAWTSTTVTGLNGTDPVVIGYGSNSEHQYIGFRWKGGVLTELGLVPGTDYAYPSAVSADGRTVVGSAGNGNFDTAFIWTDEGKLRTVVDELKARGLEPAPDLTLEFADFVSDDGKTIVGNEPGFPPTFWRVTLD